MPKPKHKKCRMCGNTYFHYDKPPCTVYFFGEDFHADLCYSCGARLVAFIMSYRQKDKMDKYVTWLKKKNMLKSKCCGLDIII